MREKEFFLCSRVPLCKAFYANFQEELNSYETGPLKQEFRGLLRRDANNVFSTEVISLYFSLE